MANKKAYNVWNLIGPGFITAALVLGPGSLTVASKIGANYEFQLLWIVPFCVLFMAAYTIVSTRIGLASDHSLLQLIREKYGKALCITIGIGLFAVAACFEAGNAIGAGMVFSELSGTTTTPWVLTFSILGIALLFFKNFYKLLEKIMILMVVVMLLSFVITLIYARPDLSALIHQFNFSIPKGAHFLSLALVASSFSIAGAFYQSYLVQEKTRTKDQSHLREREALIGILILGIITSTVLLVAASVLFPKGIQVNTAAEMGAILEPMFGNYARLIFMMGLFAASFSSLIGNATLGGVLISDAFNLGQKMASKSVRLTIMSVIIIGASVAIVFGRLPINLIITAQALTIIVGPLIGLMLTLIAFDKAAKHEITLGFGLKIILWLGLAILLVLACANCYTIFVK